MIIKMLKWGYIYKYYSILYCLNQTSLRLFKTSDNSKNNIIPLMSWCPIDNRIVWLNISNDIGKTT